MDLDISANKYYCKRYERMAQARKLGRHSRSEWLEMKLFFRNVCVRCLGESGLMNLEKDHILPIYKGGSDGIYNLQPVCARCNCSKGPETTDWRPMAAERLGLILPKKYQSDAQEVYGN